MFLGSFFYDLNEILGQSHHFPGSNVRIRRVAFLEQNEPKPEGLAVSIISVTDERKLS